MNSGRKRLVLYLILQCIAKLSSGPSQLALLSLHLNSKPATNPANNWIINTWSRFHMTLKGIKERQKVDDCGFQITPIFSPYKQNLSNQILFLKLFLTKRIDLFKFVPQNKIQTEKTLVWPWFNRRCDLTKTLPNICRGVSLKG